MNDILCLLMLRIAKFKLTFAKRYVIQKGKYIRHELVMLIKSIVRRRTRSRHYLFRVFITRLTMPEIIGIPSEKLVYRA